MTISSSIAGGGTCNAAAAFGISPFVLQALPAAMAAIAGDSYSTGSSHGAFNKFSTSARFFPGFGPFSLASDQKLVEQASEIGLHVLSPQNKPTFTPEYTYAFVPSVSGHEAALDKSSERLEASALVPTDADQVHAELIMHICRRPILFKSKYNRKLVSLFKVLLRLEAWEEIKYALEDVNERYLRGDDQDVHVEIEGALAQYVVDMMPDDVIAAAAELGGTLPDTNVKYFKMLLTRRAWKEVRGILQHADVYFSETAQRVFEGVLALHIDQHEDGVVPADVIAAAAKLGGSTIPRCVEYLRILVRRGAWKKATDVLEHASEHFSQKAKLALDEVLFNHVEEHDGEDAIPGHVLKAAYALDGAFGPAATEFKANLHRSAWDEARRALTESDNKNLLIRILAQHIRKHGDKADEVPEHVITAAMRGIKTIAEAANLFRSLLHAKAWEEVKSALVYANEQYTQGAQRELNEVLTKRMEARDDDAVRADVILAGMILHDGTIHSASNFFKALLRARAWEEVKAALEHADEHYIQLAQRNLEGALAAHIKEHGTDVVPADVIATAAKLGKSTIPRCAEYLRILVRRAAWQKVREIVEHASKRFTHDAKLALDEVLANHVKKYGEDVVPDSVLKAAYGLDGSFGPAAAELRAHLQRGEWDEAEVILIEAVKRPLFINALAMHIREHGGENIPSNVFEAAAQGSDYFELLLNLGAWHEVKRAITSSDNKDSYLSALGRHIGNHKDMDIPNFVLEIGATQARPYENDFFKALLYRKAWREAERVMISARTKKREGLKMDLANYIEHKDSDVPSHVLEIGASLGGVFAERLFKALLSRRDWEIVESVLATIVDKLDHDRFHRVLTGHIKWHGDVDIPTSVLVAAASQRSLYADDFFEILLGRKAWSEVIDVLQSPDVNLSDLRRFLNRYIRDHGGVPQSVLDAAGLGRRTSSQSRRSYQSGSYRSQSSSSRSSRTSDSRSDGSYGHATGRTRQARPRVNYFDVLGLKPSANISDADVKNAMRQKVKQWHPDRHANGDKEARVKATEQTKLILNAYRILSDPAKRRRHFLDLGYQI